MYLDFLKETADRNYAVPEKNAMDVAIRIKSISSEGEIIISFN